MSSRIPKYRLHKGTGQALVQINGERIYLGKHGTPESKEKYRRVIAEWLQAGKQQPPDQGNGQGLAGKSVNQVIVAYWQFAETYYVKNGQPDRELDNVRDALGPLRGLYGLTPAHEFGPKKLKAVRQQMIESGLCRGVINSRVSRIKRMVRWAVAEELVPPSLYHGLQAVTGLRRGKSPARETEPVRPVPDLYVAAVLAFATPHVGAMIKLQRMTGMRSAELAALRPCHINTSGDVWIYEVPDHKNQWRGYRKRIPLGPVAQQIIQPFLDRDPQACLFSPREAEVWRLEHQPPYHGRERKTPIYPSELRRRERLKQARRRHKPKRHSASCLGTRCTRVGRR
jgi:integrase